MKLSELAKNPKLVKVVIDDEKLVAKYGEPVEFFIYDRVDMEKFMALASLDGKQNIAEVVKTMKDLILDEKGNKVIDGGKILPNDIMIKAVEATVVQLGNEMTPTLQK